MNANNSLQNCCKMPNLLFFKKVNDKIYLKFFLFDLDLPNEERWRFAVFSKMKKVNILNERQTVFILAHIVFFYFKKQVDKAFILWYNVML